MPDIFLSYSRADRPKAQTLAQALEAEGLTVWWDKVLRAGQTYDEVTETMLREAKVTIVLWSETSVKSKWVRAEATLGQRYCEFVPAMIEEAERPIMFELVQTADLIGWDGDRADPRWNGFVEDVKRSLEKAKSSAPAPSGQSQETEASATSQTSVPKKKKSSIPLPLLLGLILLGGGGYYGYQTLIVDGELDVGSFIESIQASPACDLCPDMVRIEGGSFTIGSPVTERGHSGTEQPQTEITIKPFWISKTEVSRSQWDTCVGAGACRAALGGGEGGLPVIGVSFEDALAYTIWLSETSGQVYRLPSEAEWEYTARGGTQTMFWWGDTYPGGGIVTGAMQDVGTLPENPFGVSGMLGNVREWVADCYTNNYNSIPTDGRAAQSGDCSRRVVRGGSFRDGAAEHRAANRARYRSSIRELSLGFRVVAEQP